MQVDLVVVVLSGLEGVEVEVEVGIDLHLVEVDSHGIGRIDRVG